MVICLEQGNNSVPIQLAQCWFPGLAAKYKHIFQIKYAAANLSNKTAMV